VPEIVRGQLLALFKQFAAPAAVVLLADFVFLMSDRHDADWPLVWVVLMSVFVADLVTLSWVGMWTGLTSRHSNRAAAAALARVLVLPWGLFAIFLLLCS